jgi:hypothetical protein
LAEHLDDAIVLAAVELRQLERLGVPTCHEHETGGLHCAPAEC